jgi:hypothetical protein
MKFLFGQNFKSHSHGIENSLYLHVLSKQYLGNFPSEEISHSSRISL